MFEETTTLRWAVVFGLAMAAIAVVGSVTLLLREQTLEQLLLPLIGLVAGSLLGGALFQRWDSISPFRRDRGGHGPHPGDGLRSFPSATGRRLGSRTPPWSAKE
jgi:hypothetical protein